MTRSRAVQHSSPAVAILGGGAAVLESGGLQPQRLLVQDINHAVARGLDRLQALDET